MEATVVIKDEALALIEELAELGEQLQKGYVQAARGAFVPYTPTLRDLYEMIQELQAGGGTT